jgi:hypothetical protein
MLIQFMPSVFVGPVCQLCVLLAHTYTGAGPALGRLGRMGVGREVEEVPAAAGVITLMCMPSSVASSVAPLSTGCAVQFVWLSVKWDRAAGTCITDHCTHTT